MQKRVCFLSVVFVILCSVLFSLAGCGPSSTTPGTSGATSPDGVIAVLVLGPEAQAKDSSSTDRGAYVPLSGVRVSVLGGVTLFSITDSNGRATIENVPAGPQIVTVGGEGYGGYSCTVMVGGGVITQVGPATGVEIPASTSPYILDVSTLSALAGSMITITGSNFGSSQSTSTVTFNGTAATIITSWSTSQIVCKVPTGATTGNIIVTVAGNAGNGISLTIPLANNTVTYNGNGNTGGSVPTDSNNYAQGETVTVLDNPGNLVKTGLTLAGWNTAADGSGTNYTAGSIFTMGSASVTLYAKWTNNPTYTVTYNGNGNTGGSAPEDNNNYENGATVTVRGNTGSLVKAGSTFTGWNTAANGSGTNRAADSTFDIGAANVTLYAQWTAGSYALGSVGPAGGWIFYDKGSYSAGWRYLECAPRSTEWYYKLWGSFGTSIEGTLTDIGTGQDNTTLIVNWLSDPAHPESDRAAQRCAALEYGGYGDWFLPSKDELNEMYKVLKSVPDAGFSGGGNYWSSSEYSSTGARAQSFDDGSPLFFNKTWDIFVRAIRAF